MSTHHLFGGTGPPGEDPPQGPGGGPNPRVPEDGDFNIVELAELRDESWEQRRAYFTHTGRCPICRSALYRASDARFPQGLCNTGEALMQSRRRAETEFHQYRAALAIQEGAAPE